MIIDPPALLLLALAGVGAGLTGATAGLASLVSYPALLAAGLPPVTANVTNTVAMLGTTAGGTGAHVAMFAQGCAARGIAVRVFGPAGAGRRDFPGPGQDGVAGRSQGGPGPGGAPGASAGCCR